MTLGERLRSLDNQVMGEPLTREARLAQLRTQRPRFSTRTGLMAGAPGILFVLGAVWVFNPGPASLVGFAIAAVCFGWVAIRMRQVERQAITTGEPSTPPQLPQPPRLGWLPPLVLAAVFVLLSIPAFHRRHAAKGVVDLMVGVPWLVWAARRFTRHWRTRRTSSDV